MIRDWDRRRKVLDVAGVNATQENMKYREWRTRQKDLLDSNPQLKRNYAREKGYYERSNSKTIVAKPDERSVKLSN